MPLLRFFFHCKHESLNRESPIKLFIDVILAKVKKKIGIKERESDKAFKVYTIHYIHLL